MTDSTSLDEADAIVADIFDDVVIELPDDDDVFIPPKPGIKTINDGRMSADTERKIRMAQVSGKFATTLALKPVSAVITDDRFGSTPAWSDAETIYFQRDEIGDLSDDKTILAIKGLTLHEISHIMLTPRSGSNIAKQVTKADLWRAFNALEDQRIEMFMTTRYPSTIDWFNATIATYLLDTPEAVPVSFPLIHGRKYVDKDIRNHLRNSYTDPSNVLELSALIDEYVVMNMADTRNYIRAFEIIKRYDELVNSINPDHPRPGRGWGGVPDPNGHNTREGGEWKSSSNKPMGTDDQAKGMAKVAKEVAQAQKDDAPVDSSNAKGKDGVGGGDDGTGSGATGGLDDKLKKKLDDVIEDIIHHNHREIATTKAQYNGEIDLSGKHVIPPKKAEVYLQPVGVAAVQGSKSFARELEELKAKHDPGWNRRTELGKLNVERYSLGTDLDECFDEWDMGREDAVDIECFITLDTSPSMGVNMHPAYESMWAIKRALDKIGARTTVTTFSHTTEVLYSGDEIATTKMRNGGMGHSTEPLKSIRYGRSVLAQSKRAIKIFIAITDGAWYEGDEPDNIIKHLRQAGVITSLAYVSGKNWNGEIVIPNEIDSHGCEVAMNITDASQLFALARKMVQVGIKRNLGE